jgi:hypothetical protein
MIVINSNLYDHFHVVLAIYRDIFGSTTPPLFGKQALTIGLVATIFRRPKGALLLNARKRAQRQAPAAFGPAQAAGMSKAQTR